MSGLYEKRRERRRRQLRRQRMALLTVGMLLMMVPLLGSAVLPNPSNDWLNVPQDFYQPEKLRLNAATSTSTQLPELPLGEVDTHLSEKLMALTDSFANVVTPHIFVYDIDSQRYVSLNGDDDVPAASVIKLPVLLDYLQSLDKGQISPYQHLMYQDFEQTAGSGELQYQTPGKPLLAQEVATEMIQSSDNSCTNILLYERGGIADFNQRFQDWGLSKTHLGNWLPDLAGTNTVSMRDTARILYAINNSDLLSESTRQHGLNILEGTHNRRLLPALLPEGTIVAHKTGDIGRSLGDSALITLPSGRQVIVTIQVERPHNHYAAKELIQQVGKVVYDHFASQA